MKKLHALALAAIFTLFAINHSYSYDDTSEYPALTSAAMADPVSQGMTFSFSGTVISARTTKQGLILLKVQNRSANLVIDVPIFPSLGQLKEKPGLNDHVTIVGNLGQYKGTPQLQPLAAELITVASQGSISSGASHNLRDAIASGNKDIPLLIGPLTAVSNKTFTSKAGKTHLRIVVRDQTAVANAVLWGGSWDDNLRQRLNGGASFYISAKVGSFQNQPSLTIESLVFDQQ